MSSQVSVLIWLCVLYLQLRLGHVEIGVGAKAIYRCTWTKSLAPTGGNVVEHLAHRDEHLKA